MKKLVALGLLLFSISQGFCQVKIGVLRGLTAVPFAAMLENPGYEFNFYDSPVELCRNLLDGTVSAACLNSISAEGVVEKSDGVLLVTAVTSTTDFMLVGRRTNTTFSILPGKKIGIAGQGIAHRLMLFLLKQNGVPLERGDAGVELVYYSSEAEAINAYINNKTNYVITSEPATTYLCRRGQFNHISMDLQKEYKLAADNKTIPMTVLVCRTDFLEENPAESEAFKEAVENSIHEAVVHSGKVSAAVIKNNLGISQNTCLSAIKNSSFCYKPVSGDFHLIVNP